jgi:hypothetical protein
MSLYSDVSSKDSNRRTGRESDDGAEQGRLAGC